ncbi:MAG: DUF11 domain-containing protein [Thermoanaerobaculaceae bacterium]|nr:DUF11 domain-containing protein [Thermoanaerobaculaceae bacterium]MDI9621329.1 hypothetical protein [Acidobacteriota bacterium]NLH10959.1 DUF11 domain-containing protein [Holophagae bacterium]
MDRTQRLSVAVVVALVGVVTASVGAEPPPVDMTKVQPYSPPAAVPTGGPVPHGGNSIQAILDTFDRPDGPIGANWTVHDGTCNVSNNAAVCANVGRATFNGAPGTGDTAEMDVANNGTELQYAALLLNYGAGTSNPFLKVQNQSGGTQFGHAGCYTGNNGSGFGLGFFQLSSPFSTAHMKATRSGTTVTIELTNIDGGAQPNQTYVCTGAPAAEGTGVGIAGYAGYARMDNFAVNATAGPAISLVKTVGTTSGVCATTSAITVAPGTTVYYCFTVTNTGTVTLNLHDLVDDQLGPVVTGLSHALTPGSSFDTVAAGLLIPAVIDTTTTNTGTWTAYASEQEYASAQASATVTVAQPANVSGTKTVSGGPYRPGGTITYTIVLSNAGPGPQPDNPGDEFVDTLPSQLTATGASASSGTVARTGNLITWNGAIAAGGSVTIMVSATINDVPNGRSVSNQGTINYDGAGTGSNGSTRLTDDPAVPGTENPTTFVVSAPEPIPSLGPAALAGLVLLLGFAALLLLRRLV